MATDMFDDGCITEDSVFSQPIANDGLVFSHMDPWLKTCVIGWFSLFFA